MTTKEPKPGAWADFWEFVPTSGEGCREWTGPKNATINRPIYARAYEQNYAYRVAWVLTNGPIPDGLGVLHHCDNPMCCRIDHLFLGTQADNNYDMWSKGRGVVLVPKYGEEHPNVWVPDATVRAARDRYAAGGISICALARDVGVRSNVLTRWLAGTYRRDAGGPINKHLATLAQGHKLRDAKRRAESKQRSAA